MYLSNPSLQAGYYPVCWAENMLPLSSAEPEDGYPGYDTKTNLMEKL